MISSPASAVPAATPNRVFIALGSNIDAESNLVAATQWLRRYGSIPAVSTVYETLPVGDTQQPAFLNAAVLLVTPLSLSQLLDEVVPTIETALGRVRDPQRPNGPRTIDLDVVLFNNSVERCGRRQIPDPDVLAYRFMAVPLAELEPDYVHPTDGRTLAQIATALPIAHHDLQPRDDVRLQ